MSSESDKSLSPEGKIGVINILDKFIVCVNDKKSSDLEIIAKTGVRIYAHKIILHARSAVFRKLIDESENKNAEKITLKIEDFDAKVIKQMLTFIYAKKLGEYKVDVHLLELAYQYELPELKDKCQQILISLISSENAAELLYYANKCEAKKLIRKTMDFIHENPIAVINSEGWRQIKTQPNSANAFANLYEDRVLVNDYESASDKSSSPEGKVGPSDDLDKYASYVNNHLFSDLTIDSGDGHQIFVHKVILCAQSDYFNRMFSFKNFKESEVNRIEMNDFNYNVILSMLTFIYTGKVDKSEIDFELLGIAQKYQNKELKDKCQRYLISKLSRVNVVQSLVWAEHHEASDLKNEATDFIFTNPDVLKSDGWNEIKKKPHLHHIVDNLFEDLMNRMEEDGYSPPKKCARK